MSNPPKAIRKAQRLHASGQNRFALLELNALIDEQKDCWLAYCVRGRVNAALGHYDEAIADYSMVLEEPGRLNTRNSQQLRRSIDSYETELHFRKKISAWQPPAGSDKHEQDANAEKQNAQMDSIKAVGRIAQIGKFLLDQKDIAKLGKLLSQGEPDEKGMRQLTTYDVSKLGKSSEQPKQEED
jgi:tetratricopeptide (TPR) repeat protein